jgi:hypothetical protein
MAIRTTLTGFPGISAVMHCVLKVLQLAGVNGGRVGYWSPPRTAVIRWVLKPSQCIRPT